MESAIVHGKLCTAAELNAMTINKPKTDTYILAHPKTCIFNKINDAAWDDCLLNITNENQARDMYELRAEILNHGHFVNELSPIWNSNKYSVSGVQVHFTSWPPTVGELFVGYGWYFWRDHWRKHRNKQNAISCPTTYSITTSDKPKHGGWRPAHAFRKQRDASTYYSLHERSLDKAIAEIDVQHDARSPTLPPPPLVNPGKPCKSGFSYW